MKKVLPASRAAANAPSPRTSSGTTDLSLKSVKPGERVALLRLKFSSTPQLLGVVRSAVCALCESIGFSPKGSRAVIRSVDEALANVMRHAYQNRRDLPIHLTCWSVASKLPQGAKAALEIVITDRGIPMPPRKLHAPPISELDPGGLGLEWMRKSMDVVEHSRRGNTNTLRMLKYAV